MEENLQPLEQDRSVEIELNNELELLSPQLGIEKVKAYQECLKHAFKISQIMFCLNEGRDDPFTSDMYGGLKDSPREHYLMKGMNVHMILQLLNDTSDKIKTKQEMQEFLDVMIYILTNIKISDEACRILAKVYMYCFIPIAKILESTRLIIQLSDLTFDMVFPFYAICSKLRQKEVLGVDPNYVDRDKLFNDLRDVLIEGKVRVDELINRKKGNKEFFLKYLDGDDWRDLLAGKPIISVILDPSILEMLKNFHPEILLTNQKVFLAYHRGKELPEHIKLARNYLYYILALVENAGFVIEKVSDTFIDPMPDADHYRVLNCKVRIPHDIAMKYIKGGETLDGDLWLEIRFGFDALSVDHAGYKFGQETRPVINGDFHVVEARAAELQNTMKRPNDPILKTAADILKSERNDLEEDDDDEKKEKTPLIATPEEFQNSVLLLTSRGRHAIRIRMNDIVHQLYEFVGKISKNTLYPDQYLVKRLNSNGDKFVEFRIFVKFGGVDVFVKDEKIWAPYNGEFNLETYDIVMLGESNSISEEFKAKMSLTDWMDYLMKAENVEEIDFETLYKNFSNITKEEIIEFYQRLKILNQQLEKSILERGDYQNLITVMSEHKKTHNALKTQLISTSMIDALKYYPVENIKVTGISPRKLRTAFIKLKDPQIIEEICSRKDLDELVDYVYPLSGYINGAKDFFQFLKKRFGIWENKRFLRKILYRCYQFSNVKAHENSDFSRRFNKERENEIFKNELDFYTLERSIEIQDFIIENLDNPEFVLNDILNNYVDLDWDRVFDMSFWLRIYNKNNIACRILNKINHKLSREARLKLTYDINYILTQNINVFIVNQESNRPRFEIARSPANLSLLNNLYQVLTIDKVLFES